MRPPSPRTVRRVVVASVLITALHYTHNYLYIDDYPGPDWVHREIVYIAWSLLTLIGIAPGFAAQVDDHGAHASH